MPLVAPVVPDGTPEAPIAYQRTCPVQEACPLRGTNQGPHPSKCFQN